MMDDPKKEEASVKPDPAETKVNKTPETPKFDLDESDETVQGVCKKLKFEHVDQFGCAALGTEPQEKINTDELVTASEDSASKMSHQLIKHVGCCNLNCQSIESAKLIVALPYVLNFYGLKPCKSTHQPLVCEVCRNLVDIQNEDMMQALQDQELVFDVEMLNVSQETIEISDSDSSEEAEMDEPSLDAANVEMLNENFDDIFRSALEKFAVARQIQDGYSLATVVFEQAQLDIHEASKIQEDTNKRLDNLEENFYNTFANREAIYRNPVEIVDIIGPEGMNRSPVDSIAEEATSPVPAAGTLKGINSSRESFNNEACMDEVEIIESPILNVEHPNQTLAAEADMNFTNDSNCVAMKKVTQMPRNSHMLPPSNRAGYEVSVISQVRLPNQSVPPLGVLQRPPLKTGDTVYVMKNGIFGIWVRGQIDEIIPKGRPIRVTKPAPAIVLTSCVSYRMKFQFLGKAFSMKTVNGKQMAYTTPSPVRYPVGTRVIAVYQDIDVPAGSFYVGIVAEPPKEVNKHRYLIFFDDGYTQYVSHYNILLVTEASKNVYEDVHAGSREFIKQYLENFPERPMLKLSLDQVIKTEWNGKWWLAKVFELDCSLCNMHFLADSRTEWMYRGSTRLAPLYKLTESSPNDLAKDKFGEDKTIPYQPPTDSHFGRQEPPISTNHALTRAPVYRAVSASLYTSDFQEISSVSSSNSSVKTEAPVPSAALGSSRAVAKKSTSARPAYMSAAIVPGGHTIQAQSKYTNQVPGYIKHDMYATAIKHQPKKFLPHQCMASCTAWIPYVPDSMKHCGPLTVPLLNGWQRQVVKYRNKKAITYRAPCGRRIRNIDELSRYLRITKSLMGVDYFDFNYWVSCLSEFVVQRSYLNIKDLSDGKEYMPIPCINYIDHSYPDLMEYSATRQPVSGVFLNLDQEFLTGCDCADGCVNKDKCSCWQLTFAGTDYGQSGVVDNTIGYSHKRLTEPVLTGIYECNSRCKCSSTCSNRVVQNPLRAKLQVFKTPNKGWGIRSINDMPQGSFICIYAGRLLNEHEANEGGKVCGDEYLAELDYIEVVERLKEGYEEQVKELFGEQEDESKKENSENSEKGKVTSKKDSEAVEMSAPFKSRLRTRRGTTKDINRKTGVKDTTKKRKRGRQCKRPDVSDDEDSSEAVKQAPKRFTKPQQVKSIRHYFNEPDMVYIMDAKVSGNIGRYLNHSCMPNVFVQNVFVDTHDLRFPWVAFFALTFIRAGTELTWDYNYDIGSVPNKTLFCRCDSVECRGRLL